MSELMSFEGIKALVEGYGFSCKISASKFITFYEEKFAKATHLIRVEKFQPRHVVRIMTAEELDYSGFKFYRIINFPTGINSLDELMIYLSMKDFTDD
jgi:hypothetical protein